MKAEAVLAFLTFCFACATPDQQEVPKKTAVQIGTTAQTTLQWLDSAKDAGAITEGESIEIPFRFLNTGDHPLVISAVDASCGCTVAEKPEQPILPGEQGVIKARFNSAGRTGANHKSVTVMANTPEAMHEVHFEVQVNPKQ